MKYEEDVAIATRAVASALLPKAGCIKFAQGPSGTGMKIEVPCAPIRAFQSGATRDQDTTKFDYEGFLSPLALSRFAAYMHKNRVQSDGSTRASDNWQKGIPRDSYMKSLWRHLMTVWMHHRNVPEADCEDMEEALCGVIFNSQGYLHEILKAKEVD